MDKQSLNWLAKEWLKRVPAGPLTGKKSIFDPALRPIFKMMDTSSKRITNPGVVLDRGVQGIISDVPSAIGRRGPGYGMDMHHTERTLDAINDPSGLRNEYARMFLTKAMKSKGSIDELAVRQFVKENPKMVEQLLVKNDAIPVGLSIRDTAKRLSEMYPQGMIKGPVAYERGLMKRNQELLDINKSKRGVSIEENSLLTPWAQTNMDDAGKLKISLHGKMRSHPLGAIHEMGEATDMHSLFNADLPGRGRGWRHNIYPAIESEMKKWAPSNVDGKTIDKYPGVLGVHSGTTALALEKQIMDKIPRYIDPLHDEIGELRDLRDFSNEYSLIKNFKDLLSRGVRVSDDATKTFHSVVPVR